MWGLVAMGVVGTGVLVLSTVLAGAQRTMADFSWKELWGAGAGASTLLVAWAILVALMLAPG